MTEYDAAYNYTDLRVGLADTPTQETAYLTISYETFCMSLPPNAWIQLKPKVIPFFCLSLASR